jgi:hypothetical protein
MCKEKVRRGGWGGEDNFFCVVCDERVCCVIDFWGSVCYGRERRKKERKKKKRKKEINLNKPRERTECFSKSKQKD